MLMFLDIYTFHIIRIPHESHQRAPWWVGRTQWWRSSITQARDWPPRLPNAMKPTCVTNKQCGMAFTWHLGQALLYLALGQGNELGSLAVCNDVANLVGTRESPSRKWLRFHSVSWTIQQASHCVRRGRKSARGLRIEGSPRRKPKMLFGFARMMVRPLSLAKKE